MNQREEPADTDDRLFERMVTQAEAAFSLAAASEGITVEDGREQRLVQMAMHAGVLGALACLRGE